MPRVTAVLCAGFAPGVEAGLPTGLALSGQYERTLARSVRFPGQTHRPTAHQPAARTLCHLAVAAGCSRQAAQIPVELGSWNRSEAGDPSARRAPPRARHVASRYG